MIPHKPFKKQWLSNLKDGHTQILGNRRSGNHYFQHASQKLVTAIGINETVFSSNSGVLVSLLTLLPLE